MPPSPTGVRCALPDDWRPSVAIEGEVGRARFYTVSALGQKVSFDRTTICPRFISVRDRHDERRTRPGRFRLLVRCLGSIKVDDDLDWRVIAQRVFHRCI